MQRQMFAGHACLFLTALSVTAPRNALSQLGARPQITYEAIVEDRIGASTLRTLIQYDSGKFRRQQFSGSMSKMRKYIELFDGTKPEVVWGYNIPARLARPTLESCFATLSDLAKKEGEAGIRARYHIPAEVQLVVSRPVASTGNIAWTGEKKPKSRVVGKERVANLDCEVRESVFHGSDGSTRTTRTWVHPKSALVMRLEDLLEPKVGSATPPMSRTYRVVHIKFQRAIPLARFQLPTGVTAYVPETMRSVRLPKGVRRVNEANAGVLF